MLNYVPLAETVPYNVAIVIPKTKLTEKQQKRLSANSTASQRDGHSLDLYPKKRFPKRKTFHGSREF